MTATHREDLDLQAFQALDRMRESVNAEHAAVTYRSDTARTRVVIDGYKRTAAFTVTVDLPDDEQARAHVLAGLADAARDALAAVDRWAAAPQLHTDNSP